MRRTDNLEPPVVDDLRVSRAEDEPVEVPLAFYRKNFVLVLDETGEPSARANFVRGPNGE